MSPTALRASRDFVAQALARVRSGLSAYERGLDQPGPDIKVEPFDAQNVSTSAGLLKLSTSIAAARRRRANYEAAQRDVEMEREKTRAGIALLRAQTEYNLQRSKQPGGRPAATLTRDVGPYKAGTPLTDVNADLAERRLGQTISAERERNLRSGRLSSAQAGLRDIDARAERDALAAAQQQMVAHRRALEFRVNSPEPEIRDRALQALGISPSEFANQSFGPDRVRMVNDAFARLQNRVLSRTRAEANRRYEPLRQRYQSVVEEGVSGFGAAAPDENDPLGLGINPLGLFQEGEEGQGDEFLDEAESESVGEETP